jgi:hypothetical protein
MNQGMVYKSTIYIQEIGGENKSGYGVKQSEQVPGLPSM